MKCWVLQAGCKSGRRTAGYPFVPSSFESTRPEGESLDESALFGSRTAARASTFGSRVEPHGSTVLERVTGFLSAACAVHCLLTPLVVAALPLVGSSGAALSGESELLLSALVLISGTATLVLGYRRHRDLRSVGLIGGFLLLYLLGHARETSWYGTALSVVAGLGLAGASFWSARLGHSHDEQCAH
jgi:hypothetical protein